MIDEIQGPPAWEGPDVLLRQTSFRALAERRTFREAGGALTEGTLRVRFGEVEARGVALTVAGRARFDELVGEVDRRLAEDPGLTRAEVAPTVWREGLPATEDGLWREGNACFGYVVDEGARARPDEAQRRALADGRVDALVAAGVLGLAPIVYEDFLPRSAAGIFASNLTDAGSRGGHDVEQGGAVRDLAWMSDVVGAEVAVPEDVYAAESAASLEAALARLR